MLNVLTQASTQQELSELFDCEIDVPYVKQFQLRPADPMVYFDKSPQVGFWNKQAPFIDIHRSLKQKPFSRLLHSARIVIPINCFFAGNQDKTQLIKLAQQRTFFVGGVINKGQISILTVASPDVLAGVVREVPVIIDDDLATQWMSYKELIDVFDLASKSELKWFDMYPVSSEIISQSSNDARLLKAIGPSLMDSLTSDEEDLRKTLKENRTRRGK